MTENLKTIPDSITSLVALPADGLKSATVNAGLQQALKLVAVLQTTLNVEKVIKLFAQELRAVLEHKGLCYYNEAHELAFNFGETGKHTCTYRLAVDNKPLGEVILTRGQPFSESETSLLEYLLSGLVYPLRNAILYRHATTAAIKDPLTGVYNRAMLETTLVREVGLARRHKNPLSVIMMDIDHFKSINDSHGHLAGDEVIKALVARVAERIRKTDILARYGGDEFVVILSNTDLDGALILAERIRTAVEDIEYVTPAGVGIAFSISIGVAKFATRQSADVLFQLADKALYDAKRGGRNCVKSAILTAQEEAEACEGSS